MPKALLASGAVLVILATGLVLLNHRDAGNAPPSAAKQASDVSFNHPTEPQADVTPILVNGLDEQYSSQTAEDWVTNADFVADVTVTDAVALPLGDTDRKRGEGSQGRTAYLRVNKIIWATEKPKKNLPDNFTLAAWGWTFKDHDFDGKVPVVGGGGSRLEEGHRYIVGLVWEPSRCSEGDPMDPAHWSFIGTKGSIPFDSGVLGVGEFEGTVQTLKPPVGPSPEWQKTFRDSVLGKGLDGVRDALEQATPGKRRFLKPSPC